MAAAFLVLLVLAWLAWCLRAAGRSRNTGVIASTDSFKRGLEMIGPDHHSDFVSTYGRLAPVEPIRSAEGDVVGSGRGKASALVVPSSRPGLKPLRVRRARLIVFIVLSAGVLVTLGASLLGGPWELHLAFDAGLALFVSWLFEDQHRRVVERRRKVTPLRRKVEGFSELRPAAGDR